MIYVLVALESELPDHSSLDPEKFKVWYTGVGKVNAAMMATIAAAQKDCAMIVNYGTAGTLVPELAGKIYDVGIVRQRDMDARPQAELGVTPFEKTGMEGDLRIAKNDVVLSTGDNFVIESPELKSHLVDMEGYAIAKVAAVFNKKVRIVKYASDMADENAAEEWEANQSKGADMFLDLFKEM